MIGYAKFYKNLFGTGEQTGFLKYSAYISAYRKNYGTQNRANFWRYCGIVFFLRSAAEQKTCLTGKATVQDFS